MLGLLEFDRLLSNYRLFLSIHYSFLLTNGIVHALIIFNPCPNGEITVCTWDVGCADPAGADSCIAGDRRGIFPLEGGEP